MADGLNGENVKMALKREHVQIHENLEMELTAKETLLNPAQVGVFSTQTLRAFVIVYIYIYVCVCVCRQFVM